jgi:hypothetical protein
MKRTISLILIGSFLLSCGGVSTETLFRNSLCKDPLNAKCDCMWKLTSVSTDPDMLHKFVYEFSIIKDPSQRKAALQAIINKTFVDKDVNKAFNSSVGACSKL